MATMRTKIQTAFNLHWSDPQETFWGQLTEDEKRSSVDRTYSRKFNDSFAWEAAGRAKEKWTYDIYPNIKAFLNEKHKNLNPSSRKMAKYCITCWMVGKEWYLAHPAAIFVCASTKVAERGLKQIERFLRGENSGFRAYTYIASLSLNHGGSGPDPSGKNRLCGSLVNVGSALGPYERQTTVGGVVRITGCYYCMTAAHPFFGVERDSEDDNEHDNDDSDNESMSADVGMTDENTGEIKNLTANYIYSGQHTRLGGIPDEVTSNGQSFLSKRLDWALLKIADGFVPEPNKIVIPSGVLIPWRISAATPGCPLWAATGTQGNVEIRSCPTVSGLCLDESGISDVWSLNMMSHPGDSGSWVVNPYDFSIVAIIVARCEDLRITYALPARDVFRDMTRNMGYEPDFTMDDKEMLLMLATEQGKAELVEELLESALHFKPQDERGRTAVYNNALQVASKGGHDKIVQLLLDRGADSGSYGGTALVGAARGGHEKIVQLLLDRGADSGSYGGTALVGAARGGHDKIVQLLLDRGADSGSYGGTALVGAARRGHEKIVQLLLDRGADSGSYGGTALVGAAEGGHDKIVQLLLDRGADSGSYGGTALVGAAEGGHDKIVQLLLDRGADSGSYGGTALVGAARGGHDKIVQLLLDRGADSGSSGGNALVMAAGGGYDKIVQLLLDKGVEIHTHYGRYALDAASQSGYDKIVQLLLDKGVDINTSV